jgi:sec-independent protein translocase protein TatB
LFGVGPQELLIIGLLVLVVFGPKRLPSMARDFGRFIQEAQRSAEDLKGELVPEEVDEARHAAGKSKSELGSDKRESERQS